MHPHYDHLNLPDNPTAEAIQALIGDEAFAQLSVDFGGSMISIPLRAGEHSPLTFSIGKDMAQRLSDVWGGMTMTVPLQAGKKARIRRMLASKMPINKICRVIGVSRTQVYRVRNDELEKNQLDLF